MTPFSTPAAFRPRTVVVTGATSGIGRAVALDLARLGYRVVVVGRDRARCERAFDALRDVGRVPPAEPVVADLALAAEVDRAVGEIQAAHPVVDLLVNNAGAIFLRRAETSEGRERTWALNVVAGFRLTRGLRSALERSSEGGRVVNVASMAHRGQTLDLSDLEGRKHFGGWTAYGRSKLAVILLTAAWSRRIRPDRVAFFSVHPGFVRSRFGMNNSAAVRAGMHLAMVFAISPERASRTVLRAATDPSLRDRSGAYLVREQVTAPSRQAQDEAMGDRLFALLDR